jgi:hypoxanthine phosphoribosyltransferase
MTDIQIKDKKFELFISEEFIIKEIEKVAGDISVDMKGKDPIFVCILNGAFMFASDLIKRIDIPCEVDFIRLKSYEGTQTKGKVKEVQSFNEDIENRHIIIVEDIIDTGYTMHFLMSKLRANNPASVKIATLLFKPEALKTNVRPDYVAMEIPNDFIVGYGLDYNGFGRNLRNIYKIKSC